MKFLSEQKALERQQELVHFVTENSELQRRLREMGDAHANEMAALKKLHEAEVEKLNAEIIQLKNTTRGSNERGR